MNYQTQQMYPIGQSNQISNKSVEYLKQPIQSFISEEEAFQNSNLIANNFQSIQQSNDPQFLHMFDANYPTYVPQNLNGQINTPLYPIPNINPIPNASNAINYQFNYTTNETGPEGYYIGLQNTNFINNSDYYRTMVNMNHLHSFLPQMNYQSNQIAVLNNIQVNSIEPTNYLNSNYINVSSNNIESVKAASNEMNQIIQKRIVQYQDKNVPYKSQENFRKSFKSTRNKSKSISLKGNPVNSSENSNRNKSTTIHRTANLPITNESSESNISNGQSIDLLVTNLDYNISAKEWRKLLLNQFQNAIKRVHSVLIQTQPDGSNCGIVRLGSMEDARLAISQFHRKKIGYKRIQVNLVSNNTIPSPINIKQEVATLLKSVAGYSLSVYKFMELYEKKYHRSICISDFYRMKDFVEIKDVGGNQNWKIISLTNTAINSITQASNPSELGETMESLVCVQHCKEGTEDYIAALESAILPNVEISLKLFKEQVHKILQSHKGSVHLISFLSCYKSEFHDIKIMKIPIATNAPDQLESEPLNNIRESEENTESPDDESIEGVPLEHLLNCIQGIKIVNSQSGIKKIQWDDKTDGSYKTRQDQTSGSPNYVPEVVEKQINQFNYNKGRNYYGLYKGVITEYPLFPSKFYINIYIEKMMASFKYKLQNIKQLEYISNSYNQSVNGLGGILVDRLHQFSREVVDLMKHQPNCKMSLSKFIPTYHHHFGKQCRVADYGFSKLHELIEALPQVVHVIGTGYVRMLYLGHKVQVRRFTNEMMKVLKSKITKSCRLSEYPTQYKLLFHKDFHIGDYGVCFIEDLLNEIPDSTVEVINSDDDIYIAMPKRIQTSEEKERTSQFAIEVIDLLKQSPRCRLPFNKFIPSYHHHFSRQCKVAEYGFTKLIELLDAVPKVIQIIEEHGEKYVILTQYEMLRALAEQTLNLLEKSFNKRIQLSEFPNFYLKTFGYVLNLEDYAVLSLQQLFEKVPKIAKIQNYSTISPNCKTKTYNTPVESTEQVPLSSDPEDKEALVEQSEMFVCLADRNHVKYIVHKVLLVLLEIPSGSLPDYQFLEKYRYKYREEPNLMLIQNEMQDIIQIVNDSSLLQYPGSSGLHIRLKPLILFSRDLKDLMRFNQCKMPLIQLEGFYEQHYGIPLKCQNYGYPSLFSLIQACDFVVTLKGRGIRASLVLCQDFVGKLAYRIAYNTQPTFKNNEDNYDFMNCPKHNSISLNAGQTEDSDGSITNYITMHNQLTSSVHSPKPLSVQPVYGHNMYPQTNFLPPLNSYPYFNAQPMYNPWFRQWYQPHSSYGYTPNLYSHPEYGVVSIAQPTVSAVPGPQPCLPYANASQDQKQIDELVETLAYDNSCSSTLTPPPVTTFQHIHPSLEANNSIINNPWVIYSPHHQMIPSNTIMPGYITAISNGDSDDNDQPLDKILTDSEGVQCTNNNNKFQAKTKNPTKRIEKQKKIYSLRTLDKTYRRNHSKSIT